MGSKLTPVKNTEGEELLYVQQYYKDIQDSARKTYKAVIVNRFSQGLPQVADFGKGHALSRNGICQALINEWMIAHVKEGSMWNDLCQMVGMQSCFKISALQQIVQNHINMKSGPQDQKVLTELALAKQGLIPRVTIVGGASLYQESMASLAPNAALDVPILSALRTYTTAGGNTGGSYAMLSFKRAAGGHVVALFLGGASAKSSISDVAFFDPNFGDFWFDSWDNFKTFFTWLWTKSGYGNRYGGYQIRNYGKKF